MIDNEVEAFLEHYGVKGQKWGVRTAKAVGRGSFKTAKVVGKGAFVTAKGVGRGTRATYRFAKRHKKGAAVTAGILASSGALAYSKVKSNNVAKEVAGKAKAKQLLNMTFITDSKGRTSRYGDIAVKQFFPKEGMTFAADKAGNISRVKDAFR